LKIYGKNTLKIKEIDNYQHENLLMLDREIEDYQHTKLLMIDRRFMEKIH